MTVQEGTYSRKLFLDSRILFVCVGWGGDGDSGDNVTEVEFFWTHLGSAVPSFLSFGSWQMLPCISHSDMSSVSPLPGIFYPHVLTKLPVLIQVSNLMYFLREVFPTTWTHPSSFQSTTWNVWSVVFVPFLFSVSPISWTCCCIPGL